MQAKTVTAINLDDINNHSELNRVFFGANPPKADAPFEERLEWFEDTSSKVSARRGANVERYLKDLGVKTFVFLSHGGEVSYGGNPLPFTTSGLFHKFDGRKALVEGETAYIY